MTPNQITVFRVALAFLAVFLFCFEELNDLVHLIFPRWFDPWLIGFDFALLGVHPTVWLQQFATPALNELMQFAYITYYLYTVILCAALYRAGQWRAFWKVMTASAVAYTLGYLVAILLPIESPYHALAALHTAALDGGFFTALINGIEHYGRVHGAAFPSAHVSGATVALLGAWRYRRRMFTAFLPFYLLMLVSTVYGRYHYVADVLAGLLVGWVGTLLVTRREAALPRCERRRVAMVPFGGLFVETGDTQQSRFVPGAADELQADGQAATGEPAGN